LLHRIDVKTRSRVEFQDITDRVAGVLRASGIQNGVCYVFVPHTTAGITVNEHADPNVVTDIIDHLETMVPQHGGYRHMEGNSPAHIKASLMGSMQALFVEGGRLALGTWQGVFFCEFDGPRDRRVMVKVVPDPA